MRHEFANLSTNVANTTQTALFDAGTLFKRRSSCTNDFVFHPSCKIFFRCLRRILGIRSGPRKSQGAARGNTNSIMAKALKYAALAVLAASSAEAFAGSAFTGLTPKLRNSAVATRATKSHGPDMALVLVTGARLS